MILGVHHPALSVPSLADALDFYCGKLGFEIVMQAEIPAGIELMSRGFGISDSQCKIAMVKKGNSYLEMFEFDPEHAPAGDPQRPVNQHGITHICLVADDYEKDYADLQAAGVVFNTEPVGAAPARWAYGRDPFGNVLELLEHDPESAAALSH